MTKICQNPELKVYEIRESCSQIDIFQNVHQSLDIRLQEGIAFTYAVFLDNSELSLTIATEKKSDLQTHSQIKGQIFAFIPAKSASTSSLKVNAVLQASGAEVKVYLIAIQEEQAELSLQGEINISENVEKVSGHLLEEVVLLWNASYTSLQPILNVASPDVQASHGAKVHRISPEKLFYMQSKGLDMNAATGMMIDAYLQQVLGNFELSDEQKAIIYSFVHKK